jgi:membrane-associated phospholipid phosphatase
MVEDFKYTAIDVYLPPVSVTSKQINTKISSVAVVFIATVMLLSFTEDAAAQYVDSVGVRKHETLRGLYEIPARDLKFLVNETGSFSMKEWKGLYIASTNTLQLMLFFDKPIDQWIKKRPRSVAGVVWRDIARVGHTYDDLTPDVFLVLMAGSFAGVGLLSDDSYALRTAGMMIETSLITTLATSITKHTFGRSRPYVTDNPLEFDPFTFNEIRAYIDIPRAKDPRNSFMSGHTSGIFAIMTVLANRYDYWYVKVPAYTYAVSVGINRMNNPSHWASDVAFGALLGFYIGQKISDSERLAKLEKKAGVSITPAYNEFGPALRFNF